MPATWQFQSHKEEQEEKPSHNKAQKAQNDLFIGSARFPFRDLSASKGIIIHVLFVPFCG
jgi:hypothetical protein